MTTGKELEEYNITRQELADYYDKGVSTIRNWHRENPRLFKAAVLGYLSYKLKGE